MPAIQVVDPSGGVYAISVVRVDERNAPVCTVVPDRKKQRLA
jgi:hypothetical protein